MDIDKVKVLERKPKYLEMGIRESIYIRAQQDLGVYNYVYEGAKSTGADRNQKGLAATEFENPVRDVLRKKLKILRQPGQKTIELQAQRTAEKEGQV